MQHKLAQLRVLVPQQTETGQRSTQASQPVMLRTHARQQATEPLAYLCKNEARVSQDNSFHLSCDSSDFLYYFLSPPVTSASHTHK